jgi:MFS family permease
VPSLVVSWIGVACGLAVIAVSPGYPWLLFGEVLVGVGMAGNELARLLAVLEFAPGERVDRYMGLFMTLFGVRALLGSVMGAFLMELSPDGSRTGLLISVAMMVSGSFVMLAFFRRFARASLP